MNAQKQTAHTTNISGLSGNIDHRTVIQHTDGIIRIVITYDAAGFIRLKLQLLAGIDVRYSNIAIGTAHQETFFTVQGNRIAGVHGPQCQEPVHIHVADKDIFIRPRLGKFPRKRNIQRLVSRTNALLAAGEQQVSAFDIGVTAISGIVDTLVGMQTYITGCAILGSIDAAHINRGMLPCGIGAACHGNIATGLYIQCTSGLNAQGHIVTDVKGHQITAGITVSRNIGSRHIHELLHLGYAFITCQFVHGNPDGLIG